ncbi:ShlB/FhaC/HecB family hemolysin secretion/activation protein [Neorhizobium sp. T786]|uniref:ShlB/FhaC/HecB family hemolysin secretion/activation protein n=1 Tax=Pseudorhizobium xiangyangii TaxID=2883104 RepID=UPI001CFFB45F|nr:ShlB/FhaC/HecB family hemolysin secretion/activation protein [Neorhizobium xiangyangii]MCB5205369.1 ShlB/FhaC/HecB family hemolysin secretion/activation protein [Neorhizobium xiangyangii]
MTLSRVKHWHFAGWLILAGLATGQASAQSVTDVERTLRDSLQNQANAEALAERSRRDAARARTSRLGGPEGADPLSPAPGGPCFQIRQIRITGHEAFGRQPQGHRQLLDRCSTAADIAAALNRINADYQSRGYITTRAYLPEQDISRGVLEITVIPGHIEGYVYGDGRPADARIAGAFPTDRGDLLNLRDLEQGLDNYNSPRSANAKFQLVPGQANGGSFVQVLAEDGRRYWASSSSNNTGFETTGVVKSSASLGMDNLVGINDQISVGLTTTPFDPRSRRYSDSLSLNASVPYGNWSFGLDAGASRYFFMLDGINQSYPVSGRTNHVTLSAERLLMRDQRSKYYAYGELKLTRSRSYIDDFEIESQRRNLTIATLGLRGETKFDDAGLAWDAGIRFGLDAFDAYVLDKSIVDPQFQMVFARLDYQKPIAKTDLVYSAQLSAQYGDDILPGSEQFSIGGWSNVRGFHDDNLYGDSGVFLHNTLEWTAHRSDELDIRLSAGLDFGVLRPSALRDWDQHHLVGASIGANIKFRQRLNLTAEIAHALDRPSDFEAGRTVAFLGLGVSF